jgi:putative ABC transport system ATP-binding protein
MNTAVIKTQRLRKDFGAVNVLNDISIEIYEGDFTVIMGSSGSGKSTLLYALSSMDAPTQGKIELMGRNIARMRERAVADIRKRDISFIFQNINLIADLTSFENIAYPAYLAMPKSKANKRAEQLLRDFELIEQRDKYPNEMSGGQQQRIAILRAIAGDPKVIFADEPTGALNSKAGTLVLDLLTRLNEGGQTVVMVTHDIMTSVRGNRLLFLSDGQITGDLDLGRYDPAEQIAREEKVFRFLKEHQW